MPKGIRGFQKGHERFNKIHPTVIPVSLLCKICGKEFFVSPKAILIRKHCSQQCHNIANKSRKYNADWRRKIGKANSRRVWTLESREKDSLTHSRINPKGKDSHFWQGGLTKKKYPALFTKQLKERIRVRDDFKCQVCGVPELELDRRLSIHHIDYDKHNCDKSNLICLCNSCHQHTNLRHEYWKDHLTNKMEVIA